MANDYFLRAADEQSLYAALIEAGVCDFDGNEELRCTVNPGFALDVIVAIDGVTGYHANLRGELSDEQIAALPVIPEPRNPVRVWAS